MNIIECKNIIQYIIINNCDYKRCDSLYDIRPIVITKLSEINNKNYLDSCHFIIDEEIKQYLDKKKIKFVNLNDFDNNVSVNFPNIKKTDTIEMPKTFNDLTFQDKISFKKNDYEKYKNLNTYSNPIFKYSHKTKPSNINGDINGNIVKEPPSENPSLPDNENPPEIDIPDPVEPDKIDDSKEDSEETISDVPNVLPCKNPSKNSVCVHFFRTANLEIQEAYVLARVYSYLKDNKQFIKCASSYRDDNDEYNIDGDSLLCITKNNTKSYEFVFDDLNEGSNSRRRKDFINNFCKLFGLTVSSDNKTCGKEKDCTNMKNLLHKLNIVNVKIEYNNKKDVCKFDLDQLIYDSNIIF